MLATLMVLGFMLIRLATRAAHYDQHREWILGWFTIVRISFTDIIYWRMSHDLIDSPALCPQGWTRAATVTSSFGAYGVQLSLGTDTTAVVCCPQGFSYMGFDRKCSSTLFLPSTMVYFSPSSDADGAWSSTTDTSTLLISGMTRIIVSANGVPVWAQASDAVKFASAASEAASTSSSKTIITEPAKSSIYPNSTVPTITAATSTSEPHSNSNSLSTGAKIAIGIAIPFFILVIASTFKPEKLYKHFVAEYCPNVPIKTVPLP
ncbi:hypothetical protein CJF30_00009153 [Rutstroemia sp. NJR-2017a BBW]|nr:hypothetical protein CJF30_00009153 [Rutstroemia sp. NJR-2017a BBW]